MSVHTPGPLCPGCEIKLRTAHPYLSNWFRTVVKPEFQLAHISWAYRGEADQERAFTDGRSHQHFPNSPHNHMEEGIPCSLALDLFEIDEDGIADYVFTFYNNINSLNEARSLPVVWGGKFKSIGDGDHFQVDLGALQKAV